MGSDVVSCVEAGMIPLLGRIEPCKKQGLTPGARGRGTGNAGKTKEGETRGRGDTGGRDVGTLRS